MERSFEMFANPIGTWTPFMLIVTSTCVIGLVVRGVMSLLRLVIEIGFGLTFLVGAVFGAAWTLRHGDEFFGGFERGAWLGPARRVVRDVVVPNAAVFTVALIVIEAAAALGRRHGRRGQRRRRHSSARPV